MPLSKELRQNLEPLRELLWGLRNTVLPVVGSGLSQGLSLWRELLDQLAGELPEPDRSEVREALCTNDYLHAASWLEHHSRVGRERVTSKIRELYQRPSLPRPAIYRALVQLPIDHFITTNYDSWLKDALAERMNDREALSGSTGAEPGTERVGGAPRVYGPTDPGAFNDISQCSAPLVLMVHGDADRPETCVLSTEGYRNLAYGHPAWRDAMKQFIGQRRLLFIGYSLSDPDFTGLLDEWQEVFAARGHPPRHFLLTDRMTAMRASEFRRRGVETIAYSDHAVLPEVLEFLAAPRTRSDARRRDPDRHA
jgi:hypothetical protein